MAEKIKSHLEIYRVLMKDTFETSIKTKYGKQKEKNITKLILKNILTKLTQKEIWSYSQNKLGLAVLSNKGKGPNTAITCNSEKQVIEGYVDGGPYDTIRLLAQTTDVNVTSKIKKNQMVADRFYFYLYIPKDSKKALLLLETKYHTINISPAFKEFLQEILSNKKSHITFERFVPKEHMENYKNGAIVDKLTFTDTLVTGVLDEGTDENTKSYDVKITITPPSDEKSDYSHVSRMLSVISDFTIRFKENEKKLRDFTVKKGSLKNGKDEYSFSIGDDLKIKPQYKVPNELHDEDLGYLKREEIKDFCGSIIERLKEEEYLVL